MSEPIRPNASRATFAIACAAVWLLAAAPAAAQITVFSAQADTTTNVLTVQASPLASGLREFLVLNGAVVEMPVSTVTGTQATATLPPALAPGTYLLILFQPATGKAGTFDVTIGAVGPQGPAGADGNQGPPGPPGIPGANGQDGISVQSAALAPGDPNCPNGGSRFVAANGTTYACNGVDAGVISASQFIRLSVLGGVQTVLQNSFVEIHATCAAPDASGFIGSIGFKNASAATADLVVWDVSGVGGEDVGEFGPVGNSPSVDTAMKSGERIVLQAHWTDGHSAFLSLTTVYRPATSRLGVSGCIVDAIGMIK